MIRIPVRLAALLGAGLLSAAPAQAIVIDEIAGVSAAEAAAAPFGSVGRILFDNGDGSATACSGSLISTRAVLTADHCARDYASTPGSITVQFGDGGGDSLDYDFGVESVATMNPDSTIGGELLNGADLSVLTLTGDVTDRDPFLLFEGTTTGETGRAVGYGAWGTGDVGAVNGVNAVRRAADNLIDTYGLAPIPYEPGTGSPTDPAYFSGSENIYASDFDDPTASSNTLEHVGSDLAAMPLEGLIAPGDSGGPLLIRRGIYWLIAGVASGLSPDIQPYSRYGYAGYWTGVQSDDAASFLSTFEGVTYSDGTGIVPLPAAGPMLLVALILGPLRLRRKRG